MIGAVDIGGTKIAVGVVDATGRLLSRRECGTHPEAGYSSALDRIVSLLREAEARAGTRILGIGIGSTGPVYPLTGEFGDVNFFPGWRGENPVKDLERIFELPVAMENDADAAALGEAAWGVGRGQSRFIYVTVGTGIGVGVVLDGHIYRGVGHAHPEIGHHVIDPSGPPCSCGFEGCWESLAAGPAMVSWIENNAPADYPYRTHLTAKRVCELAQAGDEWALQAVRRESYYLGLGLANLVTLFVPNAIALGGGVMKSSKLFLDEIRRTIVSRCRLVPHDKTELALASLGEDSNLIGAARVWYHRFGSGGGAHAI
ncbi:MAG TPA: ROK family protein [Terriglobales bacterium]|nr:ROK family protein [Terriglobales bacterium]